MLCTFKSHSNKFNALTLSHSLFLRSWLFSFFSPSCFEELHKMSAHFLLIIAVPARKLEFTALRIYQIVLTHDSLGILLQKHAGN